MAGKGSVKKPVRVLKYRRIMDTIRSRIENGDYPADRMLPAERGLARELGTNHETVNKALSALVAEGLIYRKRGIGTFIASGRESPQAAGASVDIFFHSRASDLFKASSFHEEVMFAVQNLVIQAGTACNIVPVLDVSDLSEHLHRVGVAVVSKFLPYRLVRILAGSGLPVVALNLETGITNCSSIFVDQQGIDELAIHLASLGHRDIGFVLSPHFQPLHEERLLRFRRVMQALELPHNCSRVCFVDPDDEAAPGRLLREVRGCTALMAADDFLAIKLKHLLAKLSIQVPADVSLCGFGNLSISHTLYPGLTTADTDREALCRTITSEIMDRLHGVSGQRQCTFSTSALLRESTTKPRAQQS
jgi:GntR family transcriptional regulator of arabinose operon